MYKNKINSEIERKNNIFFKSLNPENFINNDQSTENVVNPFIKFHREKQFDLMIKCLDPKENDKILVVGVGNGREIEILLNYVENIYGVDISTNFLDYCYNKFGDRFIGREKNLEKGKIPFKSEFFDKIVCFNVLPYFSNKGIYNYYKETSRIIRNKGNMLIKIRNQMFPLSKIHERILMEKRAKKNAAIYFSSKLDDHLKIYSKFNYKTRRVEGGDVYTDINSRVLNYIFNYRWSLQVNSLMENFSKTKLKYYYRHLYILLTKF